MLEKDIEARVIEEAQSLGCIVLKLNNKASNGWPDRLFLAPGGKPIFIEFKRYGKKPTKLQYHRLGQLRELGYTADWWDNVPGAVQYIIDALKIRKT